MDMDGAVQVDKVTNFNFMELQYSLPFLLFHTKRTNIFANPGIQIQRVVELPHHPSVRQVYLAVVLCVLPHLSRHGMIVHALANTHQISGKPILVWILLPTASAHHRSCPSLARTSRPVL